MMIIQTLQFLSVEITPLDCISVQAIVRVVQDFDILRILLSASAFSCAAEESQGACFG
jgi:hypothetical protein